MQHNTKHQPVGRLPHPDTDLRLTLKTLDYDIIPTRDKKGFTGWPWQPNDPDAIRRWNRFSNDSTAIRTYGHDVFVIDIDVTTKAACDEIVSAYEERWPAFMDACLRRHSGAAKVMMIGRCATVRRSIKSRRFYTGDDDTSKGQLVETFGYADKRLVVVHGRHSEGRFYGYHGTPIWERPVTSLPWFRDEDIGPAIDIAEAIMKQHGLERRASPSHPLKLYDLLPTTLFTLSDGEVVTLKKLEEDFDAHRLWAGRTTGRSKVTGYATLWEGSTTPDRVIVTLGREGLCLFDTKTETKHRWKHCEPPSDTLGERIAELMAQMEAQVRS